MRRNLIEAWAIRVLENLKKNGQTEDHHVELKGEWVEAKKAARRIAGLANSAPDEHVLWIVGVDEETGNVRGAQEQELARWWPQVENEFADRVAPDMTPVGMTWEGQPIVAIAFATDRAPYVVRNPDFGTKGHVVAWEVPMRVGTATRTATRNQLLSLLSPTLSLPKHELVAASATLRKPVLNESPGRSTNYWLQKCRVDVRFYLIAPKGETITLDSNTCEVIVEVPGLLSPTPLGVPTVSPTDTRNVNATGNICRFTEVAHLLLKVEGDVPSIGDQPAEELRLEVKIRPIGQERKVVVSGTLGSQNEINPAAGITHSFVLNKRPVDEEVPIVAAALIPRRNPWP